MAVGLYIKRKGPRACVIKDERGRLWSVKPVHERKELLALVEMFRGDAQDLNPASPKDIVRRLLTTVAFELAVRSAITLDTHYDGPAAQFLTCCREDGGVVVIAVDRRSAYEGKVVLRNALREALFLSECSPSCVARV